MFSYYGSKSKVVHLYPKPKFGKIIEPFAGSARYSLKYFDRDVLLVDKYEVIVRIWKWLQQASPLDVLKMPKVKPGDKINRDDFDCIEQAWLMGFIVNQGSSQPKLTVADFATEEKIEKQKKTIAENLYKIKHWKIELGSYTEIWNGDEATWFIDPPYQFGGEYYHTGNKHIDYEVLADWCVSRNGQVIVCENTKANWMSFYTLQEMTGTAHTTTEAIWSNYPHNFQARQASMFEAQP
jgi:site-specific DNA-adenine methylase